MGRNWGVGRDKRGNGEGESVGEEGGEGRTKCTYCNTTIGSVYYVANPLSSLF